MIEDDRSLSRRRATSLVAGNSHDTPKEARADDEGRNGSPNEREREADRILHQLKRLAASGTGNGRADLFA